MQLKHVRILRRSLVLLIALLLAAVLINYVQTRRMRKPHPEDQTPMLGSGVVRSADSIEYSEHRNGVTKFRLRADKLLEIREGKTLLEGIEAFDFNPDGTPRNHIASRRAEYDRPNHKVFFAGDVRITLGAGVELRTDSFHYDLADDVGYTDDPIRLNSPAATGTAKGVRYDNARETLDLENDLAFLLKREVNTPGGAKRIEQYRVTSREGYYSESDHYVRFQGKARLSSEDGFLSGDSIRGSFTPDRKHLTSLSCRGGAAYRSTDPSGAVRTLEGERIDFGIAQETGALENIRVRDKARFSLESEGAGQALSASRIFLELDPESGVPRRVEGETGVRSRLRRGAQEIEIEGGRLEADFTPDGKGLSNMDVRDPARMLTSGAARGKDDLEAREIRISFRNTDGGSVPAGLQAEGSVQWTSAAADAAGSGRKLTASSLVLTYAESGDALESGEASGGAALTAAASGGSGKEPALRRLEADTMRFGFFPGGNRIRNLDGDGHVRIVYRGAPAEPGPDAESFETSSAAIRAVFLESDGSVDRVAQTGGFVYRDGTRTITSGRCDYSGGSEKLVLSDSPRITDASGSTVGKVMEYDRLSKTLSVRGSVRSVLDAGSAGPLSAASGGAGSPAVISAKEMDYAADSARARYRGGVELLSEESQLRADELTILQSGEQVEARGNVRHIVLTAAGASAAPSQAGDSKRAPVTVLCERLLYSRSEGSIHYSGKVYLESEQTDLWSDTIDVFLDVGGKRIERAAARGNVRIRRPGREVKGDAADYRLEPGQFVVTGNPAEINDYAQGRSYARRLTFSIADDSILLENR